LRVAAGLAALLLSATAHAAPAALPAELRPTGFRLDNGMSFLVVERPGRPLVSALWTVRGGSASDPPGQRGLAHVVEHLLFAGSRTIGTADWEAESRLLRQWERLYADSVRRRSAAADLPHLEGRLAELQRPGAYSAIYTRAGAFGLDAETRHDSATFQVLVPAEKIELWFWMESDRLLEPVFRGFERELRVVEQERRQRIDSSPAGSWFELFDAAFWGAGHPYAHTPGGERLEIAGLLPADARAHFEAAYGPERLVAVLVGDVSPDRVRELAERYFGRLKRRGASAGTVQVDDRPERPAAAALGSLEGLCACRRQVEIRYPTTAFQASGDGVALDVLAGVLNGRSGRLHRRLVLADDAVATSASAQHVSRMHGGYFAVRIEAAGDTGLSDLLEVWDRLLEQVREDGVERAELERVRRQLATDSFRQIETDTGLARRLAAAEVLGGWRQLDEWFEAAAAVRASDLERVVEAFLAPEKRAVLALERTEER
jgi:predicted Zn-dependent peptidase